MSDQPDQPAARLSLAQLARNVYAAEVRKARGDLSAPAVVAARGRLEYARALQRAVRIAAVRSLAGDPDVLEGEPPGLTADQAAAWSSAVVEARETIRGRK